LASKNENLKNKDLEESLDHNIVQLENQRSSIKLLEEACTYIIDDVLQSNHSKKTDVLEMLATRLDQIGQ
jgi:hypothetical protein